MTDSTIAYGSADMRALLPPVRDQGQRGTCVAFAVTAAHEAARAAGAVAAEDLSEEALFWGCKLIDGNWDWGTRFESAAAALAATGQPPEAIWPYEPRRLAGIPYNPPGARTDAWHTSGMGPALLDLASVRLEIDVGRPVVLGLTVFDSLYFPSAAGRIDVPAVRSPSRGRHAVLAVGYDADALLIRNSWGQSWGLDGYGWLSNGYAERHAHEGWVIRPPADGVAPAAGARTAGDVYGSQ